MTMKAFTRNFKPLEVLAEEHTQKWWRREQFLPRVADRLSYPAWMQQGKKSALDDARERVEELLATHQPQPLTPQQDVDIERILEKARRYYKEKGLL